MGQIKRAENQPLPMCCWCSKEISRETLWMLAAVLHEEEKPPDEEKGYWVKIKTSGDRNIWGAVAGKNSQAKQDGCDMVFLLCSEKCRQELKEELASENDLFKSVFIPGLM